MTEAISFTGWRGAQLVGIFHRRDRDVRPGAVMAYCFTRSETYLPGVDGSRSDRAVVAKLLIDRFDRTL